LERARGKVAAVVSAGRGEVVFTSGATESNNLAILGLAEYGQRTGKTHLVSTQIEHNAVLEPLHALSRRGFQVTLVPPGPGGWLDPLRVMAAVQEETLLVSVMQVNNETGVIQPIDEIAGLLADHPAYFHVDAAQGFGKLVEPLRNQRIDLLSISGHKVHAPKGIGALVARRREGERPPLAPLMHGGGQEWGLRPGTVPVHLAVGLGRAADLAMAEAESRAAANRLYRQRLLSALEPLGPVLAGDPDRAVPHIVNLSIPGLDSERAMETLAGVLAVSNGSACTSQSHTCSHVLSAMGLAAEQVEGAIRLSWCHMTPEPDWEQVVRALRRARG
jgi:cysteine desulfurase